MHSNRKYIFKPCLLILLVASLFSTDIIGQTASKVRINGFGDMTYGSLFGNRANQTQYNLFSKYGESSYPFNVNKDFGIVGTDLVATADISDNLIFQTEVNLQVERGETSDMELDVERAYLDYQISDAFGIQTGLFFTPVGFSNRNLYARAWLMNSSQIREVVEESTGLVPTHTIGINAYGTFVSDGGHALNYIASIGNGRASDPVTIFYNRNESNFMYTGLLEWQLPYGDDFRIGLSGWYADKFGTHAADTLGHVTTIEEDPANDSLALTLIETGFNPYIWYKGRKFNFFVEAHLTTVTEKDGNVLQNLKNKGFDQGTGQFGITAEFSLNLKLKGKKIMPFIRYDNLEIDKNHAYYGLRAGEGDITKYYVPNFNALMFGIAYDIKAFNRIKIEYIHHLDGVRMQHGLVLQTAFGF